MAFNNDVPSAGNQIAADLVAINANWEYVAQIASGTKMLFYADSAPTGWTIDTTPNDGLCFITKGSGASGETGGAAHSSGTWTQPNHTHTGPSHTHSTSTEHTHRIFNYVADNAYQSDGSTTEALTQVATGSGGVYGFADDTHYYAQDATAGTVTSAGGTGATGGSASANTWRPKSYCFIICSRD